MLVKKIIENFTIDIFVSEYEKAYHDVISNHIKDKTVQTI
jgi:hypothetical protein